ncbi:MAG: hypothetical protein KDC49_18780 [Saprospiraceae bacterium]|nr:hypothetical protein [Saprospiraceae bacterium]
MPVQKLPLLLISFLLFYVSCRQKEQSSVSPQPELEASTRIVTSITYGSDPDAEKDYTYNSEGEIMKYTTLGDTVTFRYTIDSIVKSYSASINQWISSIVYKLDQNGKAISSVIYGAYQKPLSEFQFLYNAEGQLSETMQKVYETGFTYRQVMKYENGDLVEIIDYEHNGNPSAKYVYNYYLDKENKLNINMHHALDDFLSKDRLGKGNQHMVKDLTNISMDGDTLSHLRFSYPQQQAENILLEIEEDVWNEFVTERTYHFR